MKKTALVLALSIVSVSCLQSKAWSTSSLLMQMPAILAASQKGGSLVINDNVTVIGENNSANIVSSNIGSTGQTELTLSGELASSVQIGSILYVLPIVGRFPFGISGRIESLINNADGTKTAILQKVSYADVIKEASFNSGSITLDASNFVGVIAPSAVQSTSPMPMTAKEAADGSVSFRNGAVVVRMADKEVLYSAADSTIYKDTVSLTYDIPLASMGVDASLMSPVSADGFVGFRMTGSLNRIKVTNDIKENIDYSLLPPRAKIGPFNLRLDGEFEFDMKFIGNGSASFGFFDQAWNDVESGSIDTLKFNALSSQDKKGKFPITGLVFSMPCPPQKPCEVKSGETKEPLESVKMGGIIIWVYLDLEGNCSISDAESYPAELHLAKLNPAYLSLGVKKTSGGDLQLIRSLTRISSSGRLLEAPKFSGRLDAQVKAGITLDVDFFLPGGLRVANAGMELVARKTMTLTGSASYGADSLNSPWSWDGSVCRTGSIGAGAIFRGEAGFGIEIHDTLWGDVDKNFHYEIQIPTNEEMDLPDWHGAWYNILDEDKCTTFVPTVTSTKTGRIWMDRNFGASRVATSMTDIEAYGDLYQWGRSKDGHEKRTSGTTTTLSSTDVPGHSNFITSNSTQYDWRSPQNNNLWQGVNGVNNPCPTGFRLPTKAEWQAEMNSWSSKNATGAFASPLKIAASGSRSRADGVINSQDIFGFYWTSTSSDFPDYNISYSYALMFTDSDASLPDIVLRAGGAAVRCIKD